MHAHEVMDINARTPQKKPAKKELREMTHSRSANGGHVFEHRFHNAGGPYIEPEQHTFGEEEGRKALEHFAEHAGLSEHMGKAEAEPEEEEA